MENREFAPNPIDPAQTLTGLAAVNRVLLTYEQASASRRTVALLKERYGLPADESDEALRNEVIAVSISPLADAGLELYTPRDIGYDEHGRKKKILAEQPLPFAVAISDAGKFGALMGYIEALPDSYQRQAQSAPIQAAIVGTNRAIKSGFTSSNPLEVANAERLLANMEQVMPSFDRIFDDNDADPHHTTARYLARWRQGTLADYLAAEELDLVPEEVQARGPVTWGANVLGEPLYTSEELGEKWRKALDYLKYLRAKESPYFTELFTDLRDAFNVSAAWIHDRAHHGQGGEAIERKDAVMDAIEALWTADFEYEDALYQMEKATKATTLAQYVLAYGLEKKDVPELLSEVDEASVIAARGLMRQSVQRILQATTKVMHPAGQLSPQYIAKRHDADGNEHILSCIKDTNSIKYQKIKNHNTLIIETDIAASDDTLEQIQVKKFVTRFGKDAAKDDAEIEVFINDYDIAARMLGAQYPGAEPLSEWLGQAESIQAAEALLRQVELEIGHYHQ